MGTHAHSFVMSFEEEKEAFKAFARSLPENCIFLIDTYETMKGVARAIEVAKEQHLKLIAVRLDSGDLLAGLNETKIMATNELTEEIIADVKANGGKISLWGVGTNLVTAKDQPALDGVYKLSAFRKGKGEWQYRLKISEQVIKTTNPGISQVRRFYDNQGYVADMLYDEGIGPGNVLVLDDGTSKEVDASWRHKDLLVPMLRGGKEVYPFPSLEGMRSHTLHELGRFPKELRTLKNPMNYVTGMEKRLYDTKRKMIEELS
jgi:nicotinate phosphoribosyltransferase